MRATNAVPDDRLLPETRCASVLIAAILVPAVIWLRNQRTDPRGPVPGEPTVSHVVRRLARMLGAGALIAATLWLVSSSIAIDVWPWQLTPLTARVLACFTAQVGVGALLLSF